MTITEQPLVGKTAFITLCHNGASVRGKIAGEYDRYLFVQYHDGKSPKDAYVPWANVASIELE